FTLLLAAEVIQTLEADDPAAPVLHEHYVIGDFLADRLFLRVAKPDGKRVSGPIVVDSHLVHRSFPFLSARVKYADITKRHCGSPRINDMPYSIRPRYQRRRDRQRRHPAGSSRHRIRRITADAKVGAPWRRQGLQPAAPALAGHRRGSASRRTGILPSLLDA